MSQENSEHDPDAIPDDWDDEDREPSRSQLRRDALAIRYLAIEIGELSPAVRSKLPLPEDLVLGMEELDRISSKNARKRHIGFITKKMRHMDLAPIEAALENRRQAARLNTHVHHSIESWRDRLMGIDEQPDPKSALTEFLNQYPNTDRQQLAQLQRKVLQELNRQTEAPDYDSSEPPRHPPSARTLFKFVREALMIVD